MTSALTARRDVANSLGNLLFEHRVPRAQSIGFIWTGVGCLILGSFLPLLVRGAGWVGAAMAWIFGVIAIIQGLIALARSRHVVAVHERGVRVTRPDGESLYLFEEIDSVSFTNAISTVAGMRAASAQILTLLPVGGAPSIRLSSEGRRGGSNTWRAGVEALAEKMISEVHGRMKKALSEGKTVPWTNAYSISPDGITTPKGHLIEWRNIEKVYIDNGAVCIKEARRFGNYVLRAGLPNLVPGYQLLLEQLQDAAARS
jgi:hypothetical protein